MAKKYRPNLVAIRISPGVCTTLPAWYHPATTTCLMTNVQVKCLLNKHVIGRVADMIKAANKAMDQTQNKDHLPNQACVCMECIQDRWGGCRNPHACAMEARTRLNDIAPKIQPHHSQTP
jgi:hypothetical protein